MPRPVSAQATYLPGLDGVRALAVIAVLGYHLEVPFLRGGLLGVGMFFTLSGFLITFILLREWDEHGRIDLKRFWLRRARRLLPAVILLLLVVLVATVLVAPDDLGDRLVESAAAMLYISNWTTIASDTSYFVAFAGPGPLDHLWSLAVEEQFYVIWPLLFVGLLTPLRRHLARVVLITLGLAAASFVWMYVVAEPGFDNTRAYEGTDTRAGGLLLGVVLAMVWRPDRLRAKIADGARNVVDGLGVVALAVLTWLVVATDPFSLSLYRGGLLLLSVATLLLLAVAVHPASRVAALLGTAPLVWIGERSYGIYLWHLPVIAFTPVTVLPEQPVVLGAIQLALSVGLSALSWTFVEDPIRRHGLLGAIEYARSDGRTRTGGRWAAAPTPTLVGGSAAVAIVGVAILAMLPVVGGTARSSASAGVPPAIDPEPIADADPDAGVGLVDAVDETESDTAALAGDPETECDAVVHIGDSTSRGLFNENQLPDPEERIDARYAAVGVGEVANEVSPAQSVVETYNDEPNSDDRVADYMTREYDGCWVFALGMQDSANQAVGGVVELGDRIDILMEQIGDQPALWMTGLALEQDGPWSDPEIRKWNDAVTDACGRWPNMRVYDWRSEAQEDWYDADGIHFNAAGDVERAARIATALAVAFPAAADRPTDCLVRSEA